MEKSKNKGSFLRFLKQNLALVIIVACAIAICVIVLVLNAANKPVTQPVTQTPGGNTGIVDVPLPDEPKKKSYVKPLGEYTLGMGYSRDAEYVLVYKKSLNEYSVHNGIDFLAEAGTPVVAVYDGTVTKVFNDYGMGQTIEITHEDGYISRYCCLSEEVSVREGQSVEAGEQIGTVGTTAAYECAEGAHLHFEMTQNGQYVNPNTKIENI